MRLLLSLILGLCLISPARATDGPAAATQAADVAAIQKVVEQFLPRLRDGSVLRASRSCMPALAEALQHPSNDS